MTTSPVPPGTGGRPEKASLFVVLVSFLVPAAGPRTAARDPSRPSNRCRRGTWGPDSVPLRGRFSEVPARVRTAFHGGYPHCPEGGTPFQLGTGRAVLPNRQQGGPEPESSCPTNPQKPRST
eukprot:scaffold1401_cov330-Pavlova_lutheri.AAC.117